MYSGIPRIPRTDFSFVVPTELTTKILRLYVAFYINPSFDITRVPLNDSSTLELQRLSE